MLNRANQRKLRTSVIVMFHLGVMVGQEECLVFIMHNPKSHLLGYSAEVLNNLKQESLEQPETGQLYWMLMREQILSPLACFSLSVSFLIG